MEIKIKKELSKVNVKYSVNPENLFGHTEKFNWLFQLMVVFTIGLTLTLIGCGER